MRLKQVQLVFAADRKASLESKLESAKLMLKMEREIAAERGWSDARKQAAIRAIPIWEKRVAELLFMVNGY